MTFRRRSVLLTILATSTGMLGCAADRAPPAKTPMSEPAAYAPQGYGGQTAVAGAYPQQPPPPAPDSVGSTTSEAKSGWSLFGSDDKKSERKASDAPGPTTPPPPPPPPQPQPNKQQPQQQQPEVAKEAATAQAPVRDLVIYTARFTMAVYQVDQGLAAVEKIAVDNGGYLGVKKDREITIRIPRGRFQPTLSAIDKVGDVLHRDIQAEDVTDEHVDLEIRIKNSRAMQKRLSDLLTKADVKNALEIEKELHRVTEELERFEGRLKVLKDRVAFSTITVSFEARGAQIQAMRQRLPFPWLGALNLPSLLSLSEDK